MAAGYFLENLFFLGTALGTIVILAWIVLRVIAGFFRKFNDTLMAEIRLSAGMRHTYIHHDDKLYHSLLKVLAPLMGDDYKNRSVTIESRQLQNGKEDFEFISPPGYGIHYIQYKGSWVRIERRQQPEVVCDKVPFEYITLSTYRWRSAHLFEILSMAKESQREHDEKKTAFYIIQCGDWTSFGEPKKRRLLDSVITAGGVKERLLKDIQSFLASEEWYMERGIPFRRGYLLYGAPGTGKSSLIRAIAGEIGYDICILSLSAKDLTDDALNLLMNSTPEKCIILLEDIDACFPSREDDCSGDKTSHLAYGGAGASKVTFRGLLNALDGVASTEGRIMFITTNHIQKLDPALIRPGRVDVRVHIDYPTGNQILQMFRRFFPNAKADLSDTFLHILMGMDKKLSMAAIQGLFVNFKDNPNDVIQYAETYLNDEYFNNKDSFCDAIEDDHDHDPDVNVNHNHKEKLGSD